MSYLFIVNVLANKVSGGISILFYNKSFCVCKIRGLSHPFIQKIQENQYLVCADIKLPKPWIDIFLILIISEAV